MWVGAALRQVSPGATQSKLQPPITMFESIFNRYRLRSVAAAVALGASTSLTAASLEIQFDEPDRFSDFEYEGMYTDRLPKQFTEAVRQTISDDLDETLPDGAHLKLTFRDIDMAGEVEFWHTELYDTRIVRDIYPPRLKFHYLAVGPDGDPMAEGVAQLSDSAFLWNIPNPANRGETFRYEQELVENWVNGKLDDLIENGEGVSS